MKNLIIISLDTLRADVAYSGAFPAIESLRARGTTFLQCVSSSPLTPISHASIFSGLQPPGHGIRHLLKESLDSTVPLLPEIANAAGYTTGAIVSCPGLNRWYGLNRGFEHYDDWIPPLADGRDAVEVADVQLRGTALKRAPLVSERAAAWLADTSQRPLLLFVHFFDAHWPYTPPETFDVPVSNPYEGEVAYMDHYCGRFLAEAARHGLTDENTITVLFSDHGEDLGGWYSNDHAGHLGYAEERGHGALLFDATQLVPLIICGAGAGLPGATVTTQVRLVDVMPTLLDLLDLPTPPMDGVTLTPLLSKGPAGGAPAPHRAAYSEAFYREELGESDPTWSHLKPLKAIRLPDRKMIWEHNGDMVSMYDLVADPEEQHPLADSLFPGFPSRL
jgi:arylsulfatase A-like enzyme